MNITKEQILRQLTTGWIIDRSERTLSRLVDTGDNTFSQRVIPFENVCDLKELRSALNQAIRELDADTTPESANRQLEWPGSSS